MRGGDPLALGVEGDAGDRGGMRQRLQNLAAPAQQVQVFPRRGGEERRFAGEGGDMLDPFRAEFRDLGDLALRA